MLCALLGGCKPARTEPAKAVPAVQVSHKVAESDLAVVKLTVAAEQRLGVETAPVVRENVPAGREYAGELLLPLGRAGASGAPSIFSLYPSATPADLIRTSQAQIDADGQVAAARVQVDGARQALKRAEDLVAGRAGLGRSVDEARTQVRLAEVALRTAEEKRALLGASVLATTAFDTLWARVAVYVGDLPRIQADAPAQLGRFGDGPQVPRLTATPIAGPLSASPNALVAELYYEVKPERSWRPGTKVSAILPLAGAERALVVPASAVLYDIHGGTWVYEALGNQSYVRRRVEVLRVERERAVLARGPAEGTRIVTVGAAELFGTEFGAGK